MRDFPFTDQLRALLASAAVQGWLGDETVHEAAPTWDEAGKLVYRFEDDAEAELFEARWLLQ